MFSEFVFKLVDGIGPVDRFGRVVVIGDVVVERAFERSGADKVIGLQLFAVQSFGNDFLLHKGLEIDKALAAAAGAINLAISDGESGKQMARPAPLVSCLVQHWFARLGWARRLLALTCLNRGFLIQTQKPGACLQERSC